MRKIPSRKHRKNKKIKETVMISTILIIVVFVCSTGYAFFKERLELFGTAKLNINDVTCNIHKFNGYNDFEITDEYTYYYSTDQSTGNTITSVDVSITIKNIGTKTVNSWRAFFRFPIDAEIVNHWNANEVYTGKMKDGVIGVYEYPSDNFNNLMAPGDSVNFHVMYNTQQSNANISNASAYGWDLASESMPSLEDMASCVLDENSSTGGESGGGTIPDPNPDPDPIIPSDDSIVASITSEYGYDTSDGLKVYVVKLQLQNNTDTDISNWFVDINIGESGNPIGCWNATCSLESGIVHITQASWGTIVNANSSVTIEFHFGTTGELPKLIKYGLLS